MRDGKARSDTSMFPVIACFVLSSSKRANGSRLLCISNGGDKNNGVTDDRRKIPRAGSGGGVHGVVREIFRFFEIGVDNDDDDADDESMPGAKGCTDLNNENLENVDCSLARLTVLVVLLLSLLSWS